MLDKQTVLGIVGYAASLSIVQTVSRAIPLLSSCFGALPNPSFESAPFFDYAMALGYIVSFFFLLLRGFVNQPLRWGCFSLLISALSFGLLSVSIGGLFSDYRDGIILLGTFLVGVGSALSFTFWQQILCSSNMKDPFSIIVVGSLVAAVPSLFLFVIGSSEIYVIAFIVFIIVDVALLAYFCLQMEAVVWQERLTVELSSFISFRRLFSSVWRYLLCIGAIGLIYRMSFVGFVEKTNLHTLYFIWSALVILSCIILLIVWKTKKKSITFEKLYGIFMVIGFIAYMLIPLFGQLYCLWVVAGTNMAFTIASMLMVFTSIRIAKNRNLNPTMVFGLFALFTYLITDSGYLVIHLAENIGFLQSLPHVVVASLLIIYLLSFVGVVLSLTRNHGSSDAKDEEITGEEAPLFDDGGIDMTSQLNQELVVEQDMIPSCCALLKQRYQLTERQTEVLELLAHGRDVKHIAETLCVSYHTAKSHCRNLYIKLDVHHKQELIDMLDDARQSLTKLS